MSQLTVDQAIQLALQHQRANQLAEAEELFRQILDAYPDQADALHLLGALYLQAKRSDLAEVRIRQAILTRREPAFLLTLGLVLQETQRHEEAVKVYLELLALKPDFIEAYAHLGVALSVLGRFDEAAKYLQEAIRLNPGHIQAQGNLGIVLCHLRRYEEAIWLLRAALARAPRSADFHASLAAALYGSGQLEAALTECREAASLNPSHAQAQNLMSLILNVLGRQKESVVPARQAALLMPNSLEIQITYGECLRQLGHLDEAAGHYQRVIDRHLISAGLHNNVGNVYKDMGRLDDAIDQYRKSVTLNPDPSIYSNLIYTMHYHPGYTPEATFKELQRYNALFCEPLKGHIRPHPNDRNPDRRLRIGYVSSEYRQHALGLNLIPLFTNHDKSQFEIVCYSSTDKPDFYTYRFRQIADKWHDTHGKSDEQIAELVRNDQIDILIDLHQHMSGTRLPLYARKPAPVQIAFAGYPGSTGLTTIDFRLTDPWLEPLEGPQHPSSEIPLRLPHTFWNYHAVIEIAVNELPAAKNGYITFGNFNNFCKFNDATLQLWAQVMNGVPKSRLLILAPEGSPRERIKTFFSTHGIAADRLKFVTRVPASEYYKLYHRIDIGLDAFPVNGHTTGMDSWWMGVPITSYIGDRPFGRAAWSQANNLNLTDLVGKTPEDFVNISIALAKDLPRLTDLRRTLRDRMKSSPLCDEKAFAQGIESAYRLAWHEWCAGKLPAIR